MKVPNELANLRHRGMPVEIAARAHALGEVEPQLGMGNRVPTGAPFYALFIAHVGQYRAPQLAILQPPPQRRQIRRERFDVRVVVLRIFAQIVTRQLS